MPTSWLISVVMLAPCADGGDRVDLTLKELVTLHQKTVDAIDPISFDLHVTVDLMRNGAPFGTTYNATWTWAKAGQKERIRFGDPALRDDDGAPTDLTDILIDADRISMLRNWDPLRPHKINPAKSRNTEGTVQVYTGDPPARDALRQIGWRFCFDLPSETRRTLTDLMLASPAARLVGKSVVDGHDCWELRFDHPGFLNVSTEGDYFSIFLDPLVGYLPRRVIEFSPHLSIMVNGQTEDCHKESIRTVKQFSSRNGAWVPAEIETRIEYGASDRRVTVHALRTDHLYCNEPLPKDALSFAFPENVLVHYAPNAPTEHKVELWGKENQPSRTITDPKDIPGWTSPQINDLSAQSGQGQPQNADHREKQQTNWLVIGNVVAIAVIILVALARRAYRK